MEWCPAGSSDVPYGGHGSFGGGSELPACLDVRAGATAILGMLVIGFALARSITGATHELFTGTERVRQGDLVHRIPVET